MMKSFQSNEEMQLFLGVKKMQKEIKQFAKQYRRFIKKMQSKALGKK